MKSPLRFLLSIALLMASLAGVGRLSACPGITGTKRQWVGLLLEDHSGMREITWDAAFTDLGVPGPFKRDHRYGLRSTGTPGLVDLGCWDEAWPSGGCKSSSTIVRSTAWTSNKKGMILSYGGRSTWLPLAAAWDGKGVPSATYRGAYLNWLLVNRGTTPSIPSETRWQRVQRGAMVVVRDLLTRSGGAPQYRTVGIGTSGRLLIPPGEGLPAAEHAVARMEPDLSGGSMADALHRTLETAEDLKKEGGCRPGIVLAISDGWDLGRTCGAGLAYESTSGYASMLNTVSAIQATGQAVVWAWSVDRDRVWAQNFAQRGAGIAFQGDGVDALDAAIRAWMAGMDRPFGLVLSLDQPLLTRVPPATLTIRANHGLSKATLNGQVLPVTGLQTLVPVTLKEGLNTFTVQAWDGCGATAESSTTITLDTIPPRITLKPAPSVLTNGPNLVLSGSVDDVTAVLTLNGSAVALDATGAFTVPAALTEGNNTFLFCATDPIGNASSLEAATVRDTIAPVVTLLNPVEGWISNQHVLAVKGHVDDASARLVVGGQIVSADAQGQFQFQLNTASEGSQLLVAMATDPAGNTGHATRGFTLDWTPPALAWITPTPEEGALVAQGSIPAAATVSESATVDLNGKALTLTGTPSQTGATTAPYSIRTDLAVSEGQVVLTLSATDPAGNSSKIERRLDVGLTAPVIQVAQPILDATNAFTTQDASTTLIGTVTAPSFVEPLTLTTNGQNLVLDAQHGFTLPMALVEGDNPVRLIAKNRFGQTAQKDLVIRRYSTSFGLRIDWPLNGFVTPEAVADVRGWINREVAQVSVNGVPATVDARNLTFMAMVPLAVGENTLVAVGTDSVGNTGRDQVRVVYVQGSDVHSRWDLPAAGSRFSTRMVHITGQADLPGVAGVTVNGVPMRLSGLDTNGRFEGELRLEQEGRNVLLMEVQVVGSDPRVERRDVFYQPELPRIRLMHPENARPGDTIPVQVLPETGTILQSADISFQGRFLARVTSPFAPVQAQIPADAVVGGSIAIDAVGQSAEGQQVQARSHVSIYGGGALLVKVFDDRTGLPFRKDAPVSATPGNGAEPVVQVSVEGGETQTVDAKGQAALTTALPDSWVKISASGWVPVWRAASVKAAQVEALMGARLTPLSAVKTSDPGSEGIQPHFAEVSDPGLSITPLSAQGLPALLSMGWSPVRAYWIEGTATFPATADVSLPASAPAELQTARFTWVTWDSIAKRWTALAVEKAAGDLKGLSLPSPGGYALIVRDPEPLSPPLPQVGEKLSGLEEDGWHDGLVASTGVGQIVLPTVEAIRGARLEPRLQVGFDHGTPLPSGLMLQADTLESYTMLDQRLIEPEIYTQDVAPHRYSLIVQPDGSHQLQSIADGLLLRYPTRMSRRFGELELIEGRILVGFYHDGVRVVESGTELLGVNGGKVTRDGVEATFAAGAFAGASLVRLQGEPDALAVWPELATMTIAKAFQLDVVGKVHECIGLAFTDLTLSEGSRPILLARRVIQGERLILAVGELEKGMDGWRMKASGTIPPLLEGGAFAIVVPTQDWNWQTGIALAPSHLLGETGSGDKALADVVLDAGWFKAVTAESGRFAAPAMVPSSGAVTLKGDRRDLGLSGSLTANVPAQDLELHLTTVPFVVLALSPRENEVVGLGEVMEIATSAPMASEGISGVRLQHLFTEGGAPMEMSVRRTLSLDGKTLLLVPEQALLPGTSYKLVVQNLQSVTGEVLPLLERTFTTASQAISTGVDFSRMKLSYPDDQFNITVTVPAGAAPAWSTVEVNALGFGSSGNAIMPPSGDLTFALKAGLGESLDVNVILRDGTEVHGTLSRYVSEDGRTTLSSAGGRVEGPGGLAVVIPPGILDKPVEFKVVPLTEPAQIAEGALQPGEKVTPALQLQIKGEVTFTQIPVVEFPASQLDPSANTEPDLKDFGNGPLAILARRTTTLPDGTPDEFFQLVDTATVQERDGIRRVVGQGGLRFQEPGIAAFSLDRTETLPGFAHFAPIVQEQNRTRAVVGRSGLGFSTSAHGLPSMLSPWGLAGALGSGAGRPSLSSAALLLTALPAATPSTDDCANRKVAGVNIPPPALGTGYGNWSLALYVLNYPALQTGYRYNSGRVYRNYNTGDGCSAPSEQCYAPLSGAEVYRGRRRVPGVNDSQRGRILAMSDDCGRYVINGIPVYDPSGNPASTAGSLVIPVNTYNAVDPRTGACSEDAPIEPANHTNTNTDYWIWISAKTNPFDENLKPPRVLADLRNEEGNASTVFHKGQAAKLHLYQPTTSVPVTMLKIQGSNGLDQTINSVSLPMDIPVQLISDGVWKATITGWSAARVQVETSVEVLVTPWADLGPSDPAKAPTLIAMSPLADGKRDPEEKVSPTDVVKLTFSEPVRIGSRTAFWMKRSDPVSGAAEYLDFRILSDGREITGPETLVVQAWLVPAHNWPLGSKIQVGVESNIIDQDHQAFTPLNWAFTVRGADEIGAIQSGTLSDLVVHKGKLYAVEKLGEERFGYSEGYTGPGDFVQGIRVFDVSSPDRPKPGVLFGFQGCVSPVLDPKYQDSYYGNGFKDAYGQIIATWPFSQNQIRMVRKAEGVSLQGKTRDLLLVATRPWQAFWGTGPNFYLNNSTLWVFDISGDAGSVDANGAPRLLMATSIGKTTGSTSICGSAAGLGSAGNFLGVIWRLAGMKILDADAWMTDFQYAPAANGITPAKLATYCWLPKGYYPGNGSVVAANDISHQHNVEPVNAWMCHSVISGDDDGKPVAFASLGLNGELVYIDTKVGTNEAMVAYEGLSSAPWDNRVQSIKGAVDGERVLRVETLRGTWQGTTGTEQGLLLLAVTTKHFWVVKATWDQGVFTATPLAKAVVTDLSEDQDLPWMKVDIQTDRSRMLVGVKSGPQGYVYSLRNLARDGEQPLNLQPIFSEAMEGPMALQDGYLYSISHIKVEHIVTKTKKLSIRNLEGILLKPLQGLPLLEDINQFYSGVFYDYTAAKLGDPNPDKTEPLDSMLMYQMVLKQKMNTNGKTEYPLLRHYYPDLGEMYLSTTVKADAEEEQAMVSDRSSWFMRGVGKLYIKGKEIPGAVVVEGMDINDGALVAILGSGQSPIRKAELIGKSLLDGIAANGSPETVKLAYAPYRFYIKAEVLTQFDAELRGDHEGVNVVKLQFNLFRDADSYAKGQDAARQELEFTVKYNSNTTLFDVVRGGIWHYDPVVSGDLPGAEGRNPLIKQTVQDWADRQAQNIQSAEPFEEAVMRRLSRSRIEGQALLPPEIIGGHPEIFQSIQLDKLGLDSIQGLLDRVLVALRRRVFVGSQSPSVSRNPEPMPDPDRPSFMAFESVNSSGQDMDGLQGDIPGAFGMRTVQVVNAIQSIEQEDMPGSATGRRLDFPDTWARDPALTKADLTHTTQDQNADRVLEPIDGRIAPAINQRFRFGGKLNPNSTLVQYWVAYPRLRTPKSRGKGLGPINSIITRDLLLGPTDPPNLGDSDDRQPLNRWLERVNNLPEPRYWEWKDNAVFDGEFRDFNSSESLPKLIRESQPLFRSSRNVIGLFSGQWFNSGVGILQMGLHAYWGRPNDAMNTGSYPTVPNPHVMFVGRNVGSGDNDALREDIRQFLLKHYRSPRIDLYINGMLIVPDKAAITMDLLQQRLDVLTNVAQELPTAKTALENQRAFARHVPLIGIYNQTTVRTDGTNTFADWDPLDIRDLLRNQEDTAFPTKPTKGEDTQRLIAVMRGVVSILWDPRFKEDIKAKWRKEPEGEPGGLVWLTKMQTSLSLHAHSQGARKAAAARTRLGVVQPDQEFNAPPAPPIDVKSQFDYIDYGNGAHLVMWWHPDRYRSMLHVINEKDMVIDAFGLSPKTFGGSFHRPLNGILQGIGFMMTPNQVLPFENGSANAFVINANGSNASSILDRVIAAGSNVAQDHAFAFHSSICEYSNANNHDIDNAYLCNVPRHISEIGTQYGYQLIDNFWDPLTYWEGNRICVQGDCGGSQSPSTMQEDAEPWSAVDVRVFGLFREDEPDWRIHPDVQFGSQGAQPSSRTRLTGSALLPQMSPLINYEIWANEIVTAQGRYIPFIKVVSQTDITTSTNGTALVTVIPGYLTRVTIEYAKTK